MTDLRMAATDELSFLLALNREDEITAVQLQRLDFLLEQRGRAIDTLCQAAHYQDLQAA
jgi:hypothetical protein